MWTNESTMVQHIRKNPYFKGKMELMEQYRISLPIWVTFLVITVRKSSASKNCFGSRRMPSASNHVEAFKGRFTLVKLICTCLQMLQIATPAKIPVFDWKTFTSFDLIYGPSYSCSCSNGIRTTREVWRWCKCNSKSCDCPSVQK